MPFEDELGDALHRTCESIRPADRPALVEGGLRRGRRGLAVRRAAVAGGALALAAVGLAGTYATGVLGERDTGGGKGSVASAGEAPGLTVEKTDGVIGAEEMIAALKALLPEGDVVQEGGRGSSKGPGSMPYAAVVLDDGKGEARISLSLNTVDPKGGADYVTCPSTALVDHDSCTAETLADGSRYMLLKGFVYGRDEGAKQWRATMITPQGVLVDASEYDSPAEKGGEITRSAPPLTAEQMKALVTDASWQPLMKDYRAEAGAARPEETRPGEPSGQEVTKTLAELLPKGLEVTDADGDAGYGFVVVDDGRGRSFVQINVQPGMGDLSPHFADATPLPDGTRVLESKEADPDRKGGVGTVGWTVDTLRPDGFRVVIMAFNAPGQGQDAGRELPALTMEQLRAIALDEKWLPRG
ncbi:hypothetical protein QFZ82_003765 [Streptomyces sp. V4I23]|uniref:hypothetical protein n=1 Tax=Streptomyces sp. V4I23 TaxID=3042282 RepID=UPI0027817F42|nr:hypothetical protein [Streptomyces sp. V4I23]MDQ1009280.1 hypothetical protein [Streptomyces sp. V4I23]